MEELPEEVKKYFQKRAQNMRKARWEGHEKQTEEERKAKRAEYMREYRKRKKT